MRALSFDLSRASSFILLQAASAPQSGQTSAANTIRLASAESRKEVTPPGKSVAFRGSPPAVLMVQTWLSPERVERKARTLPSVEKAGAESVFSSKVRAWPSVPSGRTRQRFDQRFTAL